MKVNFVLLLIIITFCGVFGCDRYSPTPPNNTDFIATVKVCRDILAFKTSIGTLDTLSIQMWTIDEGLSNAFLSVTNKAERIAVLKAVEHAISTMPYASVDARKCRCLYSSVAKAYSVVQDCYWNYADAPELAIECWFSEINHFKTEIERCKREIARYGHNSVTAMHELEDRILICNSECEKTFYKIDIRGFMGENFCRRHPESKEDFVERVRELLGRYPEWHSKRMGDSGVNDGNH